MILIHIAVAIIGLIGSFVALFIPSKRLFIVNYSLIAATLLSGTYLVIESKSSILHACISGLIYLAITNTLLFIAIRRNTVSINK